MPKGQFNKANFSNAIWLSIIICQMSSDISDEEGLHLFEEYDKKQDEQAKQKPEKQVPEESSRKRLKKHKKDKKKKKKRHIEEEYDEEEFQEENDYDDGVRSYIEEQASEESEEESQNNSSAEFEDEEQRRHWQELYRVNEKRKTEVFFDRIQGKSQDQINRIYQQKAVKRRENEAMLPSGRDFQMYYVGCKQGKQQEMVMAILNKASYYEKSQNQKFKMQIGTALALKKKYPGKIFVQAPNEKAIKDSLQGFIDINTGRITPMDHDFYSSLFEMKENKEIKFKESQFVRVKKGVYEGDLARIIKIKKNNADVILVPRINIQDILTRMREEASKTLDQNESIQKRDQILKKYTNHRMHYPTHLRPPKKLLTSDFFKEFSDLPSNKKFNITNAGLLQVNFRYDELAKPEGTMLPIEYQPFTKNGNIAEQMMIEEDKKNFNLTIKLVKGEEAEVIAGQLTGCYGLIIEVKESTAILKCKNKEMAGKVIEEPIDHLCKRFKESQRVKVVSGSEKGKTGIILKVYGTFAQIWTDNENSIKINKNNLEVYQGEAIATENLLGLKKDDLIKTTKGNIGIVISTNKDNIKMLDITNVISIVGNLDYESKINTKSLTAKNRQGDQIKNQTIVRIRSGIHEGVRCEVKHVYRDYLFLFNPEFDKTSGIVVEKADNCLVVAKNLENVGKGGRFKGNMKPSFGGDEDEDLKVGKSITIGSGPLKGYRGVIKSINKDRIEVRIPQKNCTEWIQRDKIAQSQANLDHGKTPRRGLSMTAMYAQSPMNI